jgi:uncharacterized protein (TIGR01568 family)
MKIKIKIPKSIKLYLFKQLKRLPGLKLNNFINTKQLTSSCNYPRAQSMDRRIPDVHYVTDHESNLTDIDRYVWMYFPSLDFSSDTECSSTETSTQLSPTNHEDLPTSTPNSLVATPSAADDIKEGEAGVPVVTFSTDPYNEFKRSMMTMLEAYRACNSHPSDQEFLLELALCYFAENEKRMHKHILRACNDISMEMCQSSFSYEQKTDMKVEEDGEIIDP